MPLVSVIIPTYNHRNLVAQAVDSVLSQTINDFEIVVVDDGSIDDTSEVINKFGSSRIRYFYRENDGLSGARNLGIFKAKGKYIAFLDSDDLYTERYLEIMTGRLDGNEEFGLAYSQYINNYPDGHKEARLKEDRFLSGELTRNFFGRMPRILPSATVFRRDCLRNFYFDENLKLTEDTDFYLRLSVRTKFLCVPEAIVTRGITNNSLSSKAKKGICPNTALILERFYRHFNEQGIVPVRLARKKISREYRGLARQHYNSGNRKAAIELFKKAIAYFPYDQHYYRGLLKALCMSRKKDKMPGWQMPESLPPYITVNKKAMSDTELIS